jgi:hypothetical protein
MRKIVLIALATIVSMPAHAALTCNMVDTVGNSLTYVFKPNTTNSNGSFGGTLVEDGFSKNGRVTMSQVGNRPIWQFTGNIAGGFNIYSREAMGWHIDVVNGSATLLHGDRFAGNGSCVLRDAVTAANVGDQGL